MPSYPHGRRVSDRIPASRPTPAIVEQFLAGAANQGERIVALTRGWLGGALLLRFLLDGGFTGLVALRTRALVATVSLSLAVLFSVWELRRLRRPGPVHRLLYASVAADALLIFTAVLPTVVWPTPSFLGLLRHPDAAVILLATIAAGFRLSVNVAITGAILQTVIALALLSLDLALNESVRSYGASQLVVGVLLVGASALLGIATAHRSRRLVYSGAQAVFDAERARQRLGTYLSEEVAAEALEHTNIIPGGRRQPVSVLFSDLRSFATYAEQVAPERLVAELNAYLEAMVDVIRQEGGVVDKYIGDSIMVVFGVPNPRGDDAVRAIRTAAGMSQALTEHNAVRAKKSLPPLRHGIGVHHGQAIAGNIGTTDRMQYTVMGDAVNLASRLESATKSIGDEVLISAETVAEAGAPGEDYPALEPRGEITVRGREAPLEVFAFAREK